MSNVPHVCNFEAFEAFQRERKVCMIFYAATKKVRNKVTVDTFSAEDHRELLNSL